MEIYLNKEKTLKLCTDPMNAWICKRRETDQGKVWWENSTGYYGRLDHLLNKLVDNEINTADIDDLGGLLAKILEIRLMIAEAIPVLQKTFTEKRIAASKRA